MTPPQLLLRPPLFGPAEVWWYSPGDQADGATVPPWQPQVVKPPPVQRPRSWRSSACLTRDGVPPRMAFPRGRHPRSLVHGWRPHPPAARSHVPPWPSATGLLQGRPTALFTAAVCRVSSTTAIPRDLVCATLSPRDPERRPPQASPGAVQWPHSRRPSARSHPRRIPLAESVPRDLVRGGRPPPLPAPSLCCRERERCLPGGSPRRASPGRPAALFAADVGLFDDGGTTARTGAAL